MLLPLLGLTGPVACAGATGSGGADAGDLGDLQRPGALFARGLAAHAEGDTARAEQYLAAALERGQPAEEVLPALLTACLDGDRFDSALFYARARLLGRPDDWSLRYLVASLHLAVGQPGRAQAELDRLLAAGQERPEIFYLLAVLSRDHRADPPAARRAFRRYLELAPRGRYAGEAHAFLAAPAQRRRSPNDEKPKDPP